MTTTFTTLEQALEYVSDHFQEITETLFEPDMDACKYVAAWIVSKQGNRDIQTIRNVLRYFSRKRKVYIGISTKPQPTWTSITRTWRR
jgi:hypothetical protein